MTEDFKDKIKNLQYKGIPVFGRDSNPQNSSEFFALAGTAFLWLIIFLFLLFAHPFAKKPEYKTVQIVLSSTPVAKTEKKESAASSAASQKAQSTEKKSETKQIKQVTESSAPAKPKTEQNQKTEVKKITETPKKSAEKPAATKPATANKTAESKPTAAAKNQAPAAPVEYAQDPMEAFNNQLTQNSNRNYGNYDPFANMTDDTPEIENQNHIVTTANSMSNESVAFASSDDTGIKSVRNNNEGEINSAGSETSKTLLGIASIKPGSAGQFLTNVADTGGKGPAFTTTEGFGHSGRFIISSEPINISEKNAQTITSDLTFEITFKIQPAGTVSKYDIEFESKANIILTDAVCEEIKSIISRWTFSAANTVSIAKFSLTIKRR